ncbi:DHH family phosphoesterase, partial [Bacillus mycoides]|uniref:DHH family phosphoesterase n=1 Tax=Bacillus mycoides TaxID=1405 RepID=UPI003CC7F441
HNPSMLMQQNLFHNIQNLLLIHHHPPPQHFIDHPLLLYIHPYPSSTAQLVTHLLQYHPKPLKITILQPTPLLPPIIVHTK